MCLALERFEFDTLGLFRRFEALGWEPPWNVEEATGKASMAGAVRGRRGHVRCGDGHW